MRTFYHEYIHTLLFSLFAYGSSDSKAFICCNAGDSSSISGWENPLVKVMATHSSILAWRIPWTEEVSGYSPWGCKELDMTKHINSFTFTHFKFLYLIILYIYTFGTFYILCILYISCIFILYIMFYIFIIMHFIYVFYILCMQACSVMSDFLRTHRL